MLQEYVERQSGLKLRSFMISALGSLVEKLKKISSFASDDLKSKMKIELRNFLNEQPELSHAEKDILLAYMQ